MYVVKGAFTLPVGADFAGWLKAIAGDNAVNLHRCLESGALS